MKRTSRQPSELGLPPRRTVSPLNCLGSEPCADRRDVSVASCWRWLAWAADSVTALTVDDGNGDMFDRQNG